MLEKPTPALLSKIIYHNLNGTPFNEQWEYHSVIEKLNFLEKLTRLDIGYAAHQCAHFSVAPQESHAIAVKQIGRYLKDTKDKGHIFDPTDYSFEVYADANHAGNWHFEGCEDDIATAKSRTGYVIKYAGCPIVWHSKLQTKIALSSTEAEYICLSESLHNAIPMMQLIKEIQDRGFKVPTSTPLVHCRIFEDNAGDLELTLILKLRAYTKHLNIKAYHFRPWVQRGLIITHHINILEQSADLATKPLGKSDFKQHHFALMGW
jgi:hypothetical protein